MCSSFFFFNDTATTEIYTLSLHDALPIFRPGPARRRSRRPRPLALDRRGPPQGVGPAAGDGRPPGLAQAGAAADARARPADRKSTRLNSSHANISYAVFCLKKKKKKQYIS